LVLHPAKRSEWCAGDNPNAANSTTANNMKRTSMYDGSKDDYIDGNCSSIIVLPATVFANGTKVTLLTQLDYLTVISILGSIMMIKTLSLSVSING
jgi:hypothetical protein